MPRNKSYTEDQILAAIDRVLASDGPYTVLHLADEVGVTPSALYRSEAIKEFKRRLQTIATGETPEPVSMKLATDNRDLRTQRRKDKQTIGNRDQHIEGLLQLIHVLELDRERLTDERHNNVRPLRPL